MANFEERYRATRWATDLDEARAQAQNARNALIALRQRLNAVLSEIQASITAGDGIATAEDQTHIETEWDGLSNQLFQYARDNFPRPGHTPS